MFQARPTQLRPLVSSRIETETGPSEASHEVDESTDGDSSTDVTRLWHVWEGSH